MAKTATAPLDQPFPPSPAVDPIRIDYIESNLRKKLETMNGFSADRPLFMIQKIFRDADVDKSGKLAKAEFVALLEEKLNFVGYRNEVEALFRRYDIDHSGYIESAEFGSSILNLPSAGPTSLIGRIREILARRAGGASTLKSMGKQFLMMDKSGEGLVNRSELEVAFNKFVRAFGLQINPKQFETLFDFFDYNKDGGISYDEFIKGIRGGMSAERIEFVKMAFGILDKDKSGNLTVDEISSRYDVSRHPKVLDGSWTPEQAIKTFISNWDKSGDSVVTLDEFLEYYEWISASIDNDDYFELMMRNAWHISGGSGWAQNTANLRVLVVHEDGTQTVEEVKDDLGVKKGDIGEIRRRLLAQGITDIKKISLAD